MKLRFNVPRHVSRETLTLAAYLEVEHGIAIGIEERRGDLWRTALDEHFRQHPECAVCRLVRATVAGDPAGELVT